MTPTVRMRLALAYLQRCEWTHLTFGRGVCPVCERSRPTGHSPDCDLDRAIALLDPKARFRPRPSVPDPLRDRPAA